MTTDTDPALIVRHLRTIDVAIWAEAGELKLTHPPGLLTEDDLTFLRENKVELMAHLTAPSPLPADPPNYLWRREIEGWPAQWRQRWADRAEAHQAGGLDWKVAERQALEETAPELATATVLPSPAEIPPGPRREAIDPPASRQGTANREPFWILDAHGHVLQVTHAACKSKPGTVKQIPLGAQCWAREGDASWQAIHPGFLIPPPPKPSKARGKTSRAQRGAADKSLAAPARNPDGACDAVGFLGIRPTTGGHACLSAK